MPNESFEKTVRAFIDETRKQNGGTTFTDDPDAKTLCKLIYYGWLTPMMYGPKGMYTLFLKTKHVQDSEYRALAIAEQVERPWTYDEFWVTFFALLNAKSSRTMGPTFNIGRSLIDTEVSNLIGAVEELMQKEKLTWFTPLLAEALGQMKQEGLVFQAECDRADETIRRVEKMAI